MGNSADVMMIVTAMRRVERGEGFRDDHCDLQAEKGKKGKKGVLLSASQGYMYTFGRTSGPS